MGAKLPHGSQADDLMREIHDELVSQFGVMLSIVIFRAIHSQRTIAHSERLEKVMSLFDVSPVSTRKSKPDLYSYTVRYDDGAAPNPFHGVCTLAICKPGIRRTAKPGDWVVGLGSALHDRKEHVVYAMEVEQILCWRDYDRMAPALWPHRLPDICSADLIRHLGDCLYYKNAGTIAQRTGVHSGGTARQHERQQGKDLNGYILLSTRFLYFGSSEVQLPLHGESSLRGLILGGQGHRRQSNAHLLDRFVHWYEELERGLGNGQHGWPRLVVRGPCSEGGEVPSHPACFDHDDDEDEDLEVS